MVGEQEVTLAISLIRQEGIDLVLEWSRNSLSILTGEKGMHLVTHAGKLVTVVVRFYRNSSDTCFLRHVKQSH